jgi:prophage regulatory protein
MTPLAPQDGSHDAGATPAGRTRLLRIADVATGAALSAATIWRRVADGSFPKPLYVGPKMPRWLASEVEAWIADRAALRDTGAEAERRVG